MAEVLEQAGRALRSFYDQVVAAVAGLELDPAAWDPRTYLIVLGSLLLLVAIAYARFRRRRRATGPQFLLTNGVVALGGDHEPAAVSDGGTRKPAHLVAPAGEPMQLRVTFNNLNPFPVQLLEVALVTGAARMPVVADASAVVPPNGAVDVVADVRDLPGERGTLQVYVFATRSRPQNLTLSVPLEWEPWNLRYRVKATNQLLEPSRGTASEQVIRMERAAARREALRQRVSRFGHAVRERAAEAASTITARREAAADARRAAAAEREARRREDLEGGSGPFAVPLSPAKREDDAHGAPWPDGAGPADAGPADAGPPSSRRTPSIPPWHERDVPEGVPEARDADHVSVGEPRAEKPPEERPRQRLEFPEEF